MISVMGAGSACVITIGPYDDTGGTAGAETSVLPAPAGGSVDESPLDEAQKARKEEVERYIAATIYKGGDILHAVELPSGDVLDFMDRDTLPALPYELPSLPFTAEDLVLPEGVELGLTELEQIPELLELVATATPFKRPTFWPYILGDAPDAASVEDYLTRYQEGGDPTGTTRLYAGLASLEPNLGVSGSMNQFRPEVADQSFSLLELSVSCPAEDPVQEQIGIVISVDKKNGFGMDRQNRLDGEPRLHIEYARLVNGKVRYTWDELDGSFVANPIRLHHPGQKVPVSVPGGTQVEHRMAIFQVPWGDWWITYNGDFLGYYPASLFTMLNGGACRSSWYGEVLRDPNNPVAPKTEMGSGKFVEAGFGHVAYVRNPKFYDIFWSAVEPKDDLHMVPYAPLCYERGALWTGVLSMSGPGGNNPACQWP
jgi:hypothetical protein